MLWACDIIQAADVLKSFRGNIFGEIMVKKRSNRDAISFEI